jgi:hypothetical protein
MKSLILYSFCLNFVFVTACTTLKNNTPTEGNNTQNMPIKTDEILFINLRMRSQNAHEKSIELINTIKSIGKLKTPPPQYLTNENSTYLILGLINSQKKKVDELKIEHPLMRRAESYNENGTIQQNTLDIPSAEFSVRIQNIYDARYVVIKEVIKGKLVQTSYTINLESK